MYRPMNCEKMVYFLLICTKQYETLVNRHYIWCLTLKLLWNGPRSRVYARIWLYYRSCVEFSNEMLLSAMPVMWKVLAIISMSKRWWLSMFASNFGVVFTSKRHLKVFLATLKTSSECLIGNLRNKRNWMPSCGIYTSRSVGELVEWLNGGFTWLMNWLIGRLSD